MFGYGSKEAVGVRFAVGYICSLDTAEAQKPNQSFRGDDEDVNVSDVALERIAQMYQGYSFQMAEAEATVPIDARTCC
jgi:hypothetical protein